MQDCVNSISLRKESGQMHFWMLIDHNWDEYEAWWAEEEDSADDIEAHDYIWAYIGAPATNSEEYDEIVDKALGVD